MKKVLFATSALVASAGIASADINNFQLSGSAAMGLMYTENGAANNNANDTEFDSEIDLTISWSGESNDGIAFGGSVDLSADENDQQQNASLGDGDGEVYINYQGIKVTFGDVGGQTQDAIANPGYQGTGADDLAEAGDIGDYDVAVSFSANNLSFGVSYGSDTEDFAVSVTGKAGDVAWGIASINDESGADVVELTAGYSSGAYSLNGLYADQSGATAATDLKAYGLSVGYKVGETTYTVAMSDTNVDNQDANYGVGFSTNLGGGLSFAGGVSVDGATTAGGEGITKADLGFNMAF
jgi:outer membrane protein OmpU